MGQVISGGRTRDQGEMLARARRAAEGFAAAGVVPGDVVAIYLRNDFPFFEASTAASIVGAYPTPVNWHNSPDEAAYIFQNSGAKVIVIHADLLAGIAHAIPEGVTVLVVETPPEILAAYGIDPDKAAAPAGAETWDAFIARHPERETAVEAAPGTMIYTSGTTGHPKGVRRQPPNEQQRLAVAATMGTIFGLIGYDPQSIVTVVTGPMYHSAPNAYGLIMFNSGAKVFLEARFDPEELLALIDREKVTHLHMVPTMFVRLLKLPEEVRARYDVSSLRHVVHAAAPCPVHVKQAMIAWWGPVIMEYYGGTETSAVVYCDAEQWLAHPGTVGKALPSAEILVLDDAGEPLATGGTGEIVCRLKALADFTYHGDDEKRRKSEKRGLIALGDVGYLDGDGYLYLCDRVKDMIISGGVNIYPAEIEAELLKMPGVFDCGVFGIPNDEFGEAICAYVQPAAGADLTADAVKAYLRERIAGYKVPRVVEFAAELPREDSGKIFKRKLRQPYWEAAGRQI